MQLQDTVRSEGPSSNTETINKFRSLAGASKGTEVAIAPGSEIDQSEDLRVRYRLIREFSEKLRETLQPEDCVVQTMPEASPVKWHLAHTSWFFETFVLKEALPNHNPIHAQYAYLFNSYYNAAGKMHCRPKRGLISRPTLRETLEYRRRVDGIMDAVFEEPAILEKFAPVIRLGLHHEQQHQELILTDIKHVFSENPLRPIFCERSTPKSAPVALVSWLSFPAGVCEIGYKGVGFHFDNEGPHHRQFVEAFQLIPRLVTNGDYLEFIEDGGYRRPEFWLSLGWYTVNEQRWEAPLYWEQRDGSWWVFTLAGMRELDKDEPVCHVSYFEADAFARWAKARLPNEFEEFGRIEMHLVSLVDQTVQLNGTPFVFGQGEHVVTEYSYKYTAREFAELATPFGMDRQK